MIAKQVSGKPTVGLALVGALALTALPASADTFTLRVGAGHPSGPSVYVNLVETFFVPEVKKRVAERTSHKVEFIEGYGGSIAGVADTLEAVQSGLLDVGAYCMCFEPAKLFLNNFPYWAPFGPQGSAESMKITRAVYDAHPALTEVFRKDHGQELLGLSGWDNYHLGTTMEWSTVSDLKNVKIGGAGPNLPWLEYAGAVPVQSTLPEGYMSLQTGVYNGWLMFPSSYLGFKFHEPAPNYTLIGFGPMMVNALTANSRTMDRLPPEVAAIIREVGAEYEAKSGEALDAAQERGLKGLKEAGANIRELAPEVRQGWAESMLPFPKKQATEADGRGLPGTAVMKDYLRLVAESGYQWPVAYSVD
ncbi:MAG: C4-dicarboxylate TRAP transporter substrate-binding protein [Gemmobacter sp.]|nr:C4-dicarboxylate TRAP transporter substrate-binding protein [Gemmobacter sp.]